MPTAKRPHTTKEPISAAAQQTSVVKQGAKFGLVGISNTIIDYAIYLTITSIFHIPLGDSYLVKYASGTVALINSFYWNRRWVFASHTNIGKSGIRFLLATSVSVYVIQPFMVHTFSATNTGETFSGFWFYLANSIGITSLAPDLITYDLIVKTVAFGMGVVGSAIWNFTLYKLWAFKDEAPHSSKV